MIARPTMPHIFTILTDATPPTNAQVRQCVRWDERGGGRSVVKWNPGGSETRTRAEWQSAVLH